MKTKMDLTKQMICAIMLVLLVGCMSASNDTQAETVQGDDAQLEGFDMQEAKEPVVEEHGEIAEDKEEHMFDKTFETLETKTLRYEDDTGQQYELTIDTLTIWLDETTFKRQDFVVDKAILNLQDHTATGACEEMVLRNYAGNLCAKNSGKNTELNFDDYYTKTPVAWLEDYTDAEIVRMQEDIFCQGSMTTLVEFSDGTSFWLNYKGIPLKVKQGKKVVNFFDVQLA